MEMIHCEFVCDETRQPLFNVWHADVILIFFLVVVDLILNKFSYRIMQA